MPAVALAARSALARERAVAPTEAFVHGAIAGGWLALVGHEVAGPHSHGLGVALAAWLVMSVAMMGPPAVPAIRHVSTSSLRWRRPRAVAEFSVTFGSLWLAFGVVAVVTAGWLGRSWPAVATGLAVAALWQVAPWRRRFVRACHRAVPFPPTGPAATSACIRFGRVHGLACVGSCWPVMAAMAFVPSRHLFWCAALTALVLRERSSPRPIRAARESGLALAAAATAVVVLAVVGLVPTTPTV